MSWWDAEKVRMLHRAKLTAAFLHTRTGTWLLATATAVLVWWGIREGTSHSQQLENVPVTVHAPKGWMVVSQAPREVNLTFKGSRNDMVALRREMVQVTVNLQDVLDTAPQTIALGAQHISAPRGVSVVSDQIFPQKVTVLMQPEITAKVKVRLVTRNMLPVGYDRVSEILTPSVVEVTGPANEVRGLDSVATEPVNLDGRTDSIHEPVLPLAKPAESSHIRYDRGSVQLDMGIIARLETRSFQQLPLRLLVPAGQSLRGDLDPESCNVTVHGRPEDMAKVTADDIRLFVEPATLVASETPTRRDVRANLPDGVTLVSIDPPSALVRMVGPAAPEAR